MARIGYSYTPVPLGFNKCNISQVSVTQKESQYTIELELGFENGATMKKFIYLKIEFDDNKCALVNKSVIQLHNLLDALNISNDGINKDGLFETSKGEIIPFDSLQQYLGTKIGDYWETCGHEYPFIVYTYDEAKYNDPTKIYTQAHDLTQLNNEERYKASVAKNIQKGYIKIASRTTTQQSTGAIQRPTVGKPNTSRM